MRLGSVAIGTVLLAVAFCGCGGSSSTSSSATTPHATTASSGTGSAASTLPAGTPAALRGAHGGVLLAGALPGLVPQGHVALSTSVQSWVAESPPALRASEAASLKALGFIAGLSERLAPANGGGGSEAISLVEQFRSAHGADGEIAAQYDPALKHGASAFAVPGIPGARGFGASTNGNIAFSVGPYYYIIGFSSGPAGTPTRAQLLAAAQSLYGRVRA